MTRYVIDTNVYIRAWRNQATHGVELDRFYRSRMVVTYLSSVVLHELLMGANNPRMARDLVVGLAGPFKRTRRIVVPSHSSWTQAGEVIRQLARRDGLGPAGVIGGAGRRSIPGEPAPARFRDRS